MPENELKPCPFCGGPAKYANSVNRNSVPARAVCFVHCAKCKASTNVYTDLTRDFEYMKQATEAWNRRTGHGGE